MRQRQATPLAAIVCLCAAALCGCSPRTETPSARAAEAPARTAPGGRALRPVSLPDLSTMAPSVQRQMREGHASLVSKLENRQTPVEILADAYGQLGKLLMAGDYAEAAEPCFVDAQMLAPADYHWPYYLGHLYRRRGELDKAALSFKQALALRSDDVATLVWLGDVHLGEGQPEQAEPYFSKALSLQPSSLSARFGLGRTALAKQDYRRAVSYLEEVLARDPEAAGAHYPLGLAYQGAGDVKKAEAQLRLRKNHEILPADPLMVELEELLESPQVYEKRGIQALDKHDWNEAAALFRKGLDLAPDSPALRHRLGTAMFMMGDTAGAQQQFEEVVREAPDYFLAQYSLGVILQDKGQYADAIERFSAALRARPSYTEAELRLANGLRHAGRAKEALPHYAQLLSVNANLAEARFGEAMALAQLGRYQDARERLAAAVKTYPDQPMFSHALARLLAAAPDDRVRDGGQAMRLVQQLLQKEPRTVDLGETMAMALADLGRYQEAAKLQRDLMTGMERSGAPQIAERLAGNLARYERGEPCRTPWSAGEMP